jgi:SAM-dependent methyltransferase
LTTTANEDGPKPATAARIYDYFLGGTHNFPADREAAQMLLQAAPTLPAIARVNRAFLRRSVRFLLDAGVRQFLDIGSGIPTTGNVHEVARGVPDARVVYVDIDPVAVAEGLDILDGNDGATAIGGDLRAAQAILEHPEVRRLLSFDEPVGLLLVSMLHFLDDAVYAEVERLVAASAPGSYLAISHAAPTEQAIIPASMQTAQSVYRSSTATPLNLRDRAGVERFFAGLDLVEPGLVWVPQWHPATDDPADFADSPAESAILAGVARRR